MRDNREHTAQLILWALRVVEDYGHVLEKKSPSRLTFKWPQSTLPYPKIDIAKAISILELATSNSELRALLLTMLPPHVAQYVLSATYAKNLGGARVFLDSYVPDEEAAAHAKEMKEAMDLVEQFKSQSKMQNKGRKE